MSGEVWCLATRTECDVNGKALDLRNDQGIARRSVEQTDGSPAWRDSDLAVSLALHYCHAVRRTLFRC